MPSLKGLCPFPQFQSKSSRALNVSCPLSCPDLDTSHWSSSMLLNLPSVLFGSPWPHTGNLTDHWNQQLNQLMGQIHRNTHRLTDYLMPAHSGVHMHTCACTAQAEIQSWWPECSKWSQPLLDSQTIDPSDRYSAGLFSAPWEFMGQTLLSPLMVDSLTLHYKNTLT